MEYTNKCENKLYSMNYAGCDDYKENILYFLGNKDNTFRTFGEGLEAVIKNKMPDCCGLTPKEYLKERAKENGVVFDRGTLSNWFDRGKRPKKDSNSREHAAKICFALNLSVSESRYLFENVFYDRYLYERNIKEVVYIYCLQNSLCYTDACELIDAAEATEPQMGESEADPTYRLEVEVRELKTDDELLEYIKRHKKDFELDHVRAIELRDTMISEICVSDKEAEELRKSSPEKKKLRSYLSRWLFEKETPESLKDVIKNRTITSRKFMIEYIHGVGFYSGRDSKNKSCGLKENSALCSEIVKNFPLQHTFYSKNVSSEELRKAIILLASFRKWVEYELDRYVPAYSDYHDDYMDSINGYLISCGLPELYYGHPYDWFFMHCTMEGTNSMEYDGCGPLLIYRNIIDEAFPDE